MSFFIAVSYTHLKVTKDSETPGIGGVLKNAAGKELDEGGKAPTVLIPEEIVANQSLDVDTVAGATITSAAVINAVKDCLTPVSYTHLMGKRFGSMVKEKARVLGGVILILIGLRIFVEHMFF